MDVHEFLEIPPLSGPPYDALFEEGISMGELRYRQAIRYTSREIDLFLRALTKLPGWERTLVVVTSDHGESMLGDHPHVARPKRHGFLVYETQALVPWIMMDTGGLLPAGRVVTRPVRLLDLMPTVLDAAGIAVPDGIAGASQLPRVEEESASTAPVSKAVVETRFRGTDKTAVYAYPWIYVENRDDHAGTNPRELQRAGVSADGARTDRASDHPEVVERLSGFLERWREQVPQGRPVTSGDGPSEETRRQLRDLGYLE
jgi:arylsulfatase A-like enzyme